MKEQFQRVYTWLQRHDQEWLAANQLPRQLPKPVPPRVDWEQRDGELAAAVREVGSGLRCSPEYLKQITVAAIARELGQLALIQQHLDRLPLTAKVFAGLVDPRSLDDVYLRLSEGQQLEHCQLIDAEQTFRGRDLYEALDHFEIRKQQ